MTGTLSKTPLYDWHVSRGARMVDFAGWSMPVQYCSIVDEHRATRTAFGLFDISHMGRLEFAGAGTAALLDRLVTRRVANLKDGQVRYALVTNEDGGILDDVLVYRLTRPTGEPFHLLVVNASNRKKIIDWISPHVPKEIRFKDRTFDTAMIAVQGPHAMETIAPLVSASVAQLDYYTGTSATICGQPGIVSRTGYTGEDGCEFIVSKDFATELCDQILARGGNLNAMAAGLGARDTLRLEAGMPLYGHELSEEVNPYQAGLGFAVQIKDREFVGRNALLAAKTDPDQLKRIGIELAGKRVPREHYALRKDAEVIGEVTSGTFSPTLERPIAMAYVRPEAATIGSELSVDIRGTWQPAKVVELPFYKRP